MALQPVEHRPAVEHRQRDVEDDRVGPVLVRKRKPAVATQADQALEAAAPGDVEHGPGQLRIVLDDQDGPVAGLDVLPVVLDLVREQERLVEPAFELGGLGGERLVGVDLVDGHRAGRERGRQEERERRARALLRLDPDLAA